ncbi:hypothetical protein [Constantimarinum furrinae]|uniref:Uncharacterized protein n=1 Tax=Constantimarinum furrinae TaxID=2562285 RepID=A0A7G8PUA0_9FLAO|nr:hypothetical protein [Constantimarinum furrinae]QNJ97916.1 hypothetical protein ALE3EI_1354 [Constantimarinum furrinae]
MRQILILFIMVSQGVAAQQFQKVAETPFVADTFVGIDSYKNLYFVKDAAINKTGEDGTFTFNDFQLGRITSVDIINPLKLVVFYEDTNTVVFLDNRLSEIERISFNNLPEFINISAATNAGNNKLWIFNIDTQQLELFNYRTNRKTTVSQPFSGKLLSVASNFNYCYALTDRKLRIFNIYGSLISEMDSNHFEKVVQQNEKLIALKENTLFFVTDPSEKGAESSQRPIKIPLSENSIKDLQLTQDFLYIYDGKTIHTFSLTQPKQ